MSEVEKQYIALVVDDSIESLSFLTTALEAEGVTVLLARSGEAALGIAGKIVPDIILMDAVMPGLDGFETCKRLKAMSSVAQVPVIFMTGLTETEHIVHALDVGGVDYLTKPINLDELRARIRVHLANARRAQSARVALDAAGRHLMALSSGGVTLWATPQAGKLLERTMPGLDASAFIANQVRPWLDARAGANSIAGDSLMLEAGNGARIQLMCLGMIGADEYLFRLLTPGDENQDGILRRQFGLTQRESEVLLWIARGKSNRDIGDILGLSPRTVNKHLEQVYSKLGVENRASAAIRATHILQSSLED